MFEDIASSMLSITFNTLLYLNLPPNLFKSVDDAYVKRPFVTFVFKSYAVVNLDTS